MLRPSPWTLAAALALCVAAAPRDARACGPEFPVEALSARDATLSELPDGVFALEVRDLVPKPAEPFVAVEAAAEPKDARDGGGDKERLMYREATRLLKTEAKKKEVEAAFQAILDLPEAERRRFGPMAAYTLARVGDNKKKAPERLASVREMVKKGAEDPLGLAVASFGEEARALLETGKKDAEAVKLYATQAAYGSQGGATSLLFVARRLAQDEARLKKALADPVVQKLMTTWLWTRGQETWNGASGPLSPPAALFDALAAQPTLAGADRLAAAAWRAGRFDLAEQFAPKEKTPLSLWVQAKLAVRKGDRDGAEKLLSEAVSGFPAGDDWQGAKWMPRERVESELAVLALNKGEFQDAMKHAIASCSWPDVAYLAERVLTVEELRTMVEKRRGLPHAACRGAEAPKADRDFPGAQFVPKDLDAALRSLLARRLLRSDREGESRTWFEDPKTMKLVSEYNKALERGQTAYGVDRAEALYAASLIARRDGLEIMGTEVGPDWGYVDGRYDIEKWRAKVSTGAQVLSDAEKKRVAESAPPKNVRYQYRAVAADLAEQAAALVPPRSQAYAALLCQAARNVRASDPARFKAFFKTWQKNGPFLRTAFAKGFGYTCPEPNFARIKNPPKPKEVPLMKRVRKRTLAAIGGGALLLVFGAVTLVQKRRSKSKKKGMADGGDLPKPKGPPPPSRQAYKRPER